MVKPYTIITTVYTLGQIITPLDKEQVRSECERMVRMHKLQQGKEQLIIEVVNNKTGEIREYYNSNNNKIQF